MMDPGPPVFAPRVYQFTALPQVWVDWLSHARPTPQIPFRRHFASVLFLPSHHTQVRIKGLGSAPTPNLLFHQASAPKFAVLWAPYGPGLLMSYEQYLIDLILFDCHYWLLHWRFVNCNKRVSVPLKLCIIRYVPEESWRGHHNGWWNIDNSLISATQQ